MPATTNVNVVKSISIDVRKVGSPIETIEIGKAKPTAWEYMKKFFTAEEIIEPELKKLGHQGWELVTVITVASPRYLFVFKRPEK